METCWIFPTGTGRSWHHLLEVAAYLPCLFLPYLQFSVCARSKFGIMNYWKWRWLKTFGRKTCQSGADGNPDVRLRNMALVNRCSKLGEAGSICTQGCCYCCLNWKVDFRHLTDESQSKKPATSETCCSALTSWCHITYCSRCCSII